MNIIKNNNIDKKNLKRKNGELGITLVALIVMIIIILIISGITINIGSNTIKEAKYEAIRTNMLIIQAKAKECVEEANFKLGPNFDYSNVEKLENVRQEVYEGQGLKNRADAVNAGIDVNNIPSDGAVYWVNTDALTKWGIDKIELDDGEAYFIKFNEENLEVEVYNNLGFDGVYSLKDIDKLDV